MISENKPPPNDVTANGIFLSLESMPTLIHYLVLSVLEHSLIGGRIFFSLGGGEGGENTVNLRIHHSV